MAILTGNTPLNILGTEVFQTPTKSVVVHQTDFTAPEPKVYSVVPKGPTEIEQLRAAQVQADNAAAASKQRGAIQTAALAFGLAAVGLWFFWRKK